MSRKNSETDNPENRGISNELKSIESIKSSSPKNSELGDKISNSDVSSERVRKCHNDRNQ